MHLHIFQQAGRLLVGFCLSIAFVATLIQWLRSRMHLESCFSSEVVFSAALGALCGLVYGILSNAFSINGWPAQLMAIAYDGCLFALFVGTYRLAREAAGLGGLLPQDSSFASAFSNAARLLVAASISGTAAAFGTAHGDLVNEVAIWSVFALYIALLLPLVAWVVRAPATGTADICQPLKQKLQGMRKAQTLSRRPAQSLHGRYALQFYGRPHNPYQAGPLQTYFHGFRKTRLRVSDIAQPTLQAFREQRLATVVEESKVTKAGLKVAAAVNLLSLSMG